MQNKNYNFAIGFIIVVALNIVFFVVAYIIFNDRPSDTFLARNKTLNTLQTIAYACLLAELTLFGLVQYLYVLPITYWQYKKGNKQVDSGMLTGSFFVLLLNCFWFYIATNMIG